MASLVRVVGIVAIMGTIVVAGEWPEFRGPSGNGVSDARNVPIRWSATEHVAWKTPIPGVGWSSPILSRDRIFLTTAVSQGDGQAISLRVLCLDLADGHIVWDVEVLRPEPSDAKQIHTKNSLASPTPVIVGDRLFAHFGHMGTVALDRNGKLLWQQTEIDYSPVHGNGGSPLAIGDLLVFSCDAAEDPFVVALDQGTGDVRWRTPRNTPAKQTFSFSTPLSIEIDGEQQIISPGSGFVAGYAPSDGRELWRARYGSGYSVVPRPVFAHRLLFVATGYDRPKLLAIDPVGAAGDVTDSKIVWSLERGAPLTPSPIVVGDELYVVSDNGVATCLDARSGKKYWSERLGGSFSSSPVEAEGRLYFQNEAGVTSVVVASTSFELMSRNDLEERSLASPALADGTIVLRTESHLWRIDN